MIYLLARESDKEVPLMAYSHDREYVQAQHRYAELLTDQLNAKLQELSNVLNTALRDPALLNFEAMKLPPPILRYELEPQDEMFEPPPLRWFERLLPNSEKRRQAKWDQARTAYEAAVAAWRQDMQAMADVKRQHKQIDALRSDFCAGKRRAVEECISRMLETSNYPEGFPRGFTPVYLPQTKRLLLQCEFPPFDAVIPKEGVYKYVRTRDRIEATKRAATDRRDRYKSLLAQITVRTIYEVFTADSYCNIQSVVFKGIVRDIAPATVSL
jgi:restriction system protein